MKNILNQIERKIGRNYIPDMVKYLTFAMLGVFVLDMLPVRSATALLYFDRALVLKGQVWRAVTYMVLPTGYTLLSVLINLYFFYLIGTALERSWGGARLTVYFLLGYVVTLAAGFAMGVTTNAYFYYSFLLCYAMMNPHQEIMLFFVLPVKMKWIGLAEAAVLIYTFVTSSIAYKVVLLCSLIPFFLFFGKELWLETRMAWRRLKYRINQYR